MKFADYFYTGQKKYTLNCHTTSSNNGITPRILGERPLEENLESLEEVDG